MNKLVLVSGANFLHSYSGTQHLIESLQHRGWKIEVILPPLSNKEKQNINELPFKCKWIAVEPESVKIWDRIRTKAWHVYILYKALTSPTVIFTELRYFYEASLYKKLRPKGILIHYCQELILQKDYPRAEHVAFYEKNVHCCNATIDANTERSIERQQTLQLKHPQWALLNSLPRKHASTQSKPGALSLLAKHPLPSNQPIVLYSGGIGREKPFERIVDAFSHVSQPAYLLAFCHAPADQMASIRAYAKKRLHPETFLICDSVKRSSLITALSQADIGIVDYPLSVENTANQRYCAPTKLFEYMGAGLAIAASGNSSLKNIIEKEKIGKCAQEASTASLGKTINQILANPEEMRQMAIRAKSAFNDRYCYEAACEPVLDEIITELRQAQHPRPSDI